MGSIGAKQQLERLRVITSATSHATLVAKAWAVARPGFKLGSISKQGDRYLRSLFTAGALAVFGALTASAKPKPGPKGKKATAPAA